MGVSARLVAVNVVHEVIGGAGRRTAIDKRPVLGPVEVRGDGLAGDVQCDTRHHGGRDKALYAYAEEDALWWATELGCEIPPGLFGENLTTAGLDVTGAMIGERWWIGARRTGCLVEVTMPRTPCPNLTFRMRREGFHRLFARSGRTGAYLRVVRGGVIRARSQVVVERRPGHGVTIGDVTAGLSVTQAGRLVGSGIDLAAALNSHIERALSRAG